MDISFASAVHSSVYINTYTGSVKYEVSNEHTSENKFHVERRKKYTSSAAQPITVSAYLDIKIPPKIGYAGAVSFILRIDNIYEYTISLISKAIEAGVHETPDVAEACNKIANHNESCVTVNTFYKIIEVPVLKQQEQQQVSEVFDDSDNFAFNLTNETGINGTNFSSFIQETDGASLEQDQEVEVKSDATNRTKRNNFTLHFTFSVKSVSLSSVILKAANDWKNNESAISSILLDHNVLDVENASMYEQLIALRRHQARALRQKSSTMASRVV